MNFNSVFEELNKLYEEAPKTEEVEEACAKSLKESNSTPVLKKYSKEEAAAIINNDEDLTNTYKELVSDYEAGELDHSFECGNFFNLIEDESKIVIQWCAENIDDEGREVIVDSLEAAVVTLRDIEEANGDIIVEACTEDDCEKETLKEAADEEVEIVDEESVEDVSEEPAEEIEFAEEPVEPIARQLILECSKCGAIVIKDETDVVVDEESDLANIEEECQYCEETEGYKIIGVVAPYEVAEDSEEEVAVEDESVEEPIEDAVEEAVED